MKPKSSLLPLGAFALTGLLSAVFFVAQYQQKQASDSGAKMHSVSEGSSVPSASATNPDTPEAENTPTQEEDLWPELDQLLAELKAEQQVLDSPDAPGTAEPAASPSSTESAEESATPPSLEPLIDASSATWLTSSLEQRLLNSLAMLKQIFKDQPERIQIEQVQTLENCISASAAESDLGELQVKELAAACAIALNWR
ncbi:MAG: hypothetical protein IGS03_12025 [Candidatus Sericytochromatia bacterium]|nr:hypothetical protein [Candidatus Sericytochromatia bacterium]